MKTNSFKDLIAKYKDVNLKTIHRAATPHVAVFWIDIETDTIYGDGINFNEGELLYSKTCKHMGHPGGHYYMWDQIIQKNPKWQKEQHYEDVPRGRVTFEINPSIEKSIFKIYMCPILRQYEKMVCEEYNLPEKYSRFFYNDEHYCLSNIN